MPGIRLHSTGWSIQQIPVAPEGGRRSTAPASSFPLEYLTSESRVAEEFTAQPKAGRRGVMAAGALDFSYDLAEGEAAILAIRNPSGALTFHLPVESTRRGGNHAVEVRFTVAIHSIDLETGRRGILNQAVKAILIKVGKIAADKAVSFVLPKLASAFEKASWEKTGRTEGWFRVTLRTPRLAPGIPSSTERTLLFIHGTFSNAASAFGPLAGSSFFKRVAPMYGDRVFAFNHFTISRTPEQNARMLLEALPNKTFTFDVITHSRGGLVLRYLVERASAFGPLANRFRLGRAVLVASPNDGTPLATPTRWQDTVGWIANLLELFPDNPFTTGAEFVANALTWLAHHASGDLPGLHSMDADGALIGDLQAPPGPPPNAYSALVANYNPTGDVLKRVLDTGVDQFFGSANDLVVPSEGGWRIDRSGVQFIPGNRIGCYGPGGNIARDSVTHVNFFSQPETVDFLVNALAGQPQRLAPLDPGQILPDRRIFRASGMLPAAELLAPQSITRPIAAPLERHITTPNEAAHDALHLMILPLSLSDSKHSQILAQYGSARIVEDFYVGGSSGRASARWRKITGNNDRIRSYANENKGDMPSEKELLEFGKDLFETMFPGSVRRLYDNARSLNRRGDRLNIVFTSAIPWVASMPWEFAYDPVRKTSLATEELHFIRNVMTAVSADPIPERRRLRILVASAQPIGAGQLSIEDEVTQIRSGFEPLREAGLADVDVLPRATPASLHGYVSTGCYSVVHFIGHGQYSDGKGYLLFQDESGRGYPVDDRSVREILCGRGIDLVFLNACQTGQGGQADFNSGIAPNLVQAGVPVVVANQYSVADVSATFFAQHFYWSLAHGESIGEAAREARVAVNYSLSRESIDWAVPVVYARDPNARLCNVHTIEPARMPSPVLRASARRSALNHKARVAVWDVHLQFPELKQFLDKMNAAQSYFGFEIIDLSVPMDAWHIRGRQRYLNADRFADTLAPQIPQLNVQYLSVILNEPLVCDLGTKRPDYNIYEWWPSPPKPPVLLLSTHTLELSPRGSETERAIANAAVTGITGYLMDVDSHTRGPRWCPNHYNAKLTDDQKFCKPCWNGLRDRYPEESKALKSLLEL